MRTLPDIIEFLLLPLTCESESESERESERVSNVPVDVDRLALLERLLPLKSFDHQLIASNYDIQRVWTPSRAQWSVHNTINVAVVLATLATCSSVCMCVLCVCFVYEINKYAKLHK